MDRNCIFILSISYISVLAGLYLGAGGDLYLKYSVGVNSNVRRKKLALQDICDKILHAKFEYRSSYKIRR